MSEREFFKCNICGNTATLIKSGGNKLSCCGQTMSELEANTVDASKEKHVPVIETEGAKIKVKVGSEPHPMIPEHYIEWIAVETNGQLQITYLKPGMKPESEFTRYIQQEKVPYTGKNDAIVPNCEAQNCNFTYDEVSTDITAYEFCNLHGLWKTEFKA
ncbi:MAG: desulfoferrodoxin family protein [Clostridia bacterium]|jgi:superoxide reductase